MLGWLYYILVRVVVWASCFYLGCWVADSVRRFFTIAHVVPTHIERKAEALLQADDSVEVSPDMSKRLGVSLRLAR